jgi:hypothetical protein
MKHHIKDVLQIAAAILLTGSMAHAMSPTDVPQPVAVEQRVEAAPAAERIKPRKAAKKLSKRPKNVLAAIPKRVFCGTPAQQNWKQINVKNARIGQKMAKAQGWTGKQWEALLELWACESSWHSTADNTAGSGAYGIAQFMPYTWAPYGPKTSDPVKQIKYGLEYIKRHGYGTPLAALNYHYTYNSY